MEMLTSNDANILYITQFTEKLEGFSSRLMNLQEKIFTVYNSVQIQNQASLTRFEGFLDFCINWLISMKFQTIKNVESAINSNIIERNNLEQVVHTLSDKISIALRELQGLNIESFKEVEAELMDFIPSVEKNMHFALHSYIEQGNWVNLLCPLVNMDCTSVGVRTHSSESKGYSWCTVNEITKQEKSFNRTIEKQLEKGFRLNAKVYYIHHHNHGPIFAYADLQSMTITYADSQRTFALVRRVKERNMN